LNSNDKRGSDSISIEESIKINPAEEFTKLGQQHEYKKAFECYFKGSECGSNEAPHYIAEMLDEGHGCEKDITKAFKWELIAANRGNPISQLYVGFYYRDGKVVPQDYKKALQYFTLAADNGQYDAAFILGINYLRGDEISGTDIAKVEKYLFIALETAKTDEEKGSVYNELGTTYGGCYAADHSSSEFRNRCLWFLDEAAKLGNKNAKVNREKMEKVFEINKRIRKEVSKMRPRLYPILSPDFCKE